MEREHKIQRQETHLKERHKRTSLIYGLIKRTKQLHLRTNKKIYAEAIKPEMAYIASLWGQAEEEWATMERPEGKPKQEIIRNKNTIVIMEQH